MEDWHQIIKDYESSGLSGKQFSKTHGITPATFYYWKKKILSNQALGFIPVDINKSEYYQYEIEYPNGVKVRPQGGLSLAALQSLIHV